MAKETGATATFSQALKNLNLYDWLSGYDDEAEAKAEADERREELKSAPSSVQVRSRRGSENRKKKGRNNKAIAGPNEDPPPGDEQENAHPLRMPLVWIDLEMTGLDPNKDRILEIACIITDGRLGRLEEGPDLVINQSEELIASMGEWCTEHHVASGLVEGVRKSKVTEGEAERQVLEFVRHHCPSTGPPPNLAGNSVHVDYVFLKKYMPDLAACFSHILVDVSTVRALCIRWFPKDNKSAPAKKQRHRALEDIKESIAELAYLRKAIFRGEGR